MFSTIYQYGMEVLALSIKLTYKDTMTEYDADKIKLDIIKNGQGSYLEDDVLIEAESGIVDIATAAEMDSFLTEDNAGKFVRYTGTTTTKYHSGSVYKVVHTSGATYENQGTYGFEVDNTILELDPDVYDNFYKSNNYHKTSTSSVVKISWIGSRSIDVWINSYAESNYDYTIASTLNAPTVPTQYSSANVQMHTRGFQKNPRNGLTETNFKKYTYTGGEGTNFIYIIYRKDGSTDTSDDRGYFVISKTEGLLFEEYPILDTDITNITDTSKTDVTHSKNAQVVDSDLVAGNIKNGVNILGVLGTYNPTPNLQDKYITENGAYAADEGYDGLGVVTVNVTSPGPGPTPGSGYSITLMRNGYENDSDIWFKINGVNNRVDVTEDGNNFYKYPPMSGIETIAVTADHFSTPFSVASSWFRIKPLNSSVWHNLSKDEVYTLVGDSVLQFAYGSCLLKGSKILMANGTNKNIEDIRVGDLVLGYYGPVYVIGCDTEQVKTNDWYDEWEFEDGTIICTVHQHEFYNVSKEKYCYMKKYEGEDDCGADEWDFGDYGLTCSGKLYKLISHKHIKTLCQHFTLYTEDNTYYVNGFLSGNRNSVEIRRFI